ncbi:MAG: topoisomerase IV [Clostridia bacterium]|nr:topoisomerase IV [Clostridia bacterium]
MPYAMSVIISRAIPQIDGFKPSHRKLLYTMYKMGLLTGQRTKSANVVGQTMKLNPHGDAAIYETLVRLTADCDALLTPFVDSKGSFGKQYSRDMAFAASRYTEVKLAPICAELFKYIDRDTVDMVPNYDNTMEEPVLLPTTYPNILVSYNQGIAVGMASTICGFNLGEVCDTTVEYLKNPDCDLKKTLIAPDFSTGAQLIYNDDEIDALYSTGRGSVKLRAKYTFDKKNNCIEVTEIPYSTTIEAIMEKIIDLVKAGKLREVSDVRDETALAGLKIAIDLKRGTDPELLMDKLYKLTPLQDSVSCNFNVLVGSTPILMGVREILEEWTAFRIECIKRRLYFDLTKAREKLHLLLGLEKILLDIDRAIAIVRGTEKDSEVVPNLMKGFDIDEPQAEFIAEIKLRHLNRQYILERTGEIASLKKDIADMEETLKSKTKIKRIIIKEVSDVAKKYRKPRRTMLIMEGAVREYSESQTIEDYPCSVFATREGYFKKITPQSLRVASEQKFKDGDELVFTVQTTNKAHALFFTDRYNVYKARLYDFDDTKASALGDYLPAKLSMEQNENVVFTVITGDDYAGQLLFFDKSGRASKVPLVAYQTKTNRKKLTGAYCEKFTLAGAYHIKEDADFTLYSDGGRMLTVNSSLIPEKTTRASQGVIVMTLKTKKQVTRAVPSSTAKLADPNAYRIRKLPSSGYNPKPADEPYKQMEL